MKKRIHIRSAKIGFPARLAAIDIGSNAMRFIAADFTSARAYSLLESERYPVRLGHDVYLSGKLARETMQAAIEGLQHFRRKMEEFQVPLYWTVATSAVRESKNGSDFLERILHEVGLKVEVITGSEEARLVHLAVRSRIPLGQKQWILADLGGGSVEVSLVDGQGVRWSESHTMGSVRLLEELAGAGEEPGRYRRLLSEYISTLRIPSFTKYTQPAGFIATGGNIESLAKLANAPLNGEGVNVLPLKDLQKVIESLSRLSFHQRVDILDLREDRADVILPAALVYERLAVLAGLEEILVPNVGVKEGVLLDLAESLSLEAGEEDAQEKLIMDAAVNLGRRYLFEEDHARQVARLALLIFDQLTELHRLGQDERRMLMAAAILHEIGVYISYHKHHKHSYYILANSDLPGFSSREMEIIANVARYHRKSEPGNRHANFATLKNEDQERVQKLAALLRLADAMDREHLQKVQRIEARITDKQVTLLLVASGDLLIERWALKKKSSLFNRTFQRTIEFQTKTAGEK
ncbi:MAG: Ppx/GppA family phosphatase [Acidobacteria bacterium]|nr:Ppx/GppA family phosphatase [Acidobacteriota bacterium]